MVKDEEILYRVINKWFDKHENLSKEQLETLSGMYEMLHEVANEELGEKKLLKEEVKQKGVTPIEVKPKTFEKYAIHDRQEAIKSALKQGYKRHKGMYTTFKRGTQVFRWCKVCGLIKPIEDFGTDNSKRFGKAYYCKDCTKEYHRRRSGRYREELHQGVPTSVCSRCKQVKPITAFYANKAKASGINSWCKECQNKRTKQRRKFGKTTKLSEKELHKLQGTTIYSDKKSTVIKINPAREVIEKICDEKFHTRDEIVEIMKKYYPHYIYSSLHAKAGCYLRWLEKHYHRMNRTCEKDYSKRQEFRFIKKKDYNKEKVKVEEFPINIVPNVDRDSASGVREKEPTLWSKFKIKR